MSPTRTPTSPRHAARDLAAFDDEIEHGNGDPDVFLAAVHAAHLDSPARPLDYAETRILAFARRVYRTPAAREQAVRDEFGYGATVFYQRLNALLDRPEALAADPELVRRLRRVRDLRRTRTQTGSAA